MEQVSPVALYTAFIADVRDTSELAAGGETLPPDCTVREYALRSCLGSLVKKFAPVSEDKIREDRARDLFLAMNDRCRSYNFEASVDSLSLRGLEIHERVVDLLYHAVMNWDGLFVSWEDLFQRGKFGPGSSAFVKGTSEYEKLSNDLSCTSPWLYQQWLADIARYPLELDAEFTRELSGGRVVIKDANKLGYVRKNSEIDRTICSEPSLNMLYQQGLASCLSVTLKKKFKVNLELQQGINRMLARVGSATGQYSTIDLSSASDLIALPLVRNLFPAEFFDLLGMLRASKVEVGGSTVDLHMVSSMGNAFTFPLMTLIYSAIVRAAYAVYGISYRGCDAQSPTFGVNGDDIVCDSRVYDAICEVLMCYGFSVNERKSFSDGYFRESCGGDYYLGHYVRGVYCTRLETKQDIASLVNRLNVWSARWQVPIRRTLELLLGALGKGFPLVPRWEDDAAGIKVPFELLQSVWSGMKVPDLLENCGLEKIYLSANTRSIVYKKWSERPKKVVVDPVQKGWVDGLCHWNLSLALLLSAKGSIRSGTFTVRLDRARYETSAATAPGWELYADPTWRDLSIPAVGRTTFLNAFNVNFIPDRV